jgi:hypothetical protein
MRKWSAAEQSVSEAVAVARGSSAGVVPTDAPRPAAIPVAPHVPFHDSEGNVAPDRRRGEWSHAKPGFDFRLYSCGLAHHPSLVLRADDQRKLCFDFVHAVTIGRAHSFRW